jgi:hypothetical protein
MTRRSNILGRLYPRKVFIWDVNRVVILAVDSYLDSSFLLRIVNVFNDSPPEIVSLTKTALCNFLLS